MSQKLMKSNPQTPVYEQSSWRPSDGRYWKATDYPEIKGVYQLRGGSDSGGVYQVKLSITDIWRTPEGLVIEVE
jgi:hypothetical protein